MHPVLRFGLALLVTACSSGPGGHAAGERRAAAPPASAATSKVESPAVTPLAGAAVAGDPERGKALVAAFECSRCHDGTGHPAMATEKHCAHCHEDIATGRFGAGLAKAPAWKKSVAPYRWVPSLEAVGRRFRREWLVSFLQNPADLRPHLAATMPRLALSPAQAADVAAYLTRGAPPATATPALDGDAPKGSLRAGRELMEQKGCGSCHEFTGVPPLPSRPTLAGANDRTRHAVELAPDLRYARERFRRDALVAWLVAPASLKADTLMPTHALSEKEATDIARYLVLAKLELPAPSPATERLPLLDRRVSYREVEEHVLSITCRHCHGDPDVAGGDGGPGNTGGFGFAPRGLDLSTYRSAQSGYVGDDRERHSLFEKDASGVPLLVSALLARHREEAGSTVPGVRGMPLGLPSVPLEAIQLVDTWIAQGRPL